MQAPCGPSEKVVARSFVCASIYDLKIFGSYVKSRHRGDGLADFGRAFEASEKFALHQFEIEFISKRAF